MKKIKIVHIVHGLVSGGVETVILNYFSHMNLENYDVDIITQGDSSEKCVKEFEKLGFNIYTVTKKKVSLIKNFKEIYTILKKNKYDIIHCHMTFMNFFPLFIAYLCGVKVRISHSHSAKKIVSKFNRFFGGLGKYFATDYFACGNDAAKCLFGKEIYKNKNFYKLNNGVDLNKYKFNSKIRKEVRSELGINNKVVVIGNIGRFVEQKNHEFLIDVFKKLKDKRAEVVLLLIGNGELMQQIKDKVRSLGLDKYVIFTGIRNDVEKLYQAMDIMVMTSISEGLPVVAVEAQVSGLNLILSSEITEEVKINNNVEYLSLKKSADYWAEKILNNIKNYSREENTDKIKDCGFDIDIEATKLDLFYKMKVYK